LDRCANDYNDRLLSLQSERWRSKGEAKARTEGATLVSLDCCLECHEAECLEGYERSTIENVGIRTLQLEVDMEAEVETEEEEDDDDVEDAREDGVGLGGMKKVSYISRRRRGGADRGPDVTGNRIKYV
jgi:hypothetical protein